MSDYWKREWIKLAKEVKARYATCGTFGMASEERDVLQRELGAVRRAIYKEENMTKKRKMTKKATGFRIKEVGFGLTINMGNYQSKRVDLTADVPTGMSHLEALGRLQREARKMEEVMKRGGDVDDALDTHRYNIDDD